MITDNLQHLIQYTGPEDSKIICDFIDQLAENTEHGTWYELQNNLRAVVLRQSNFQENTFESHKKYQDIHIILKGNDQINLGDDLNPLCTQQYVEKDDYSLFISTTVLSTKLLPNSFAILNPNELHNNHIDHPDTLKVVIKRRM